jgi:hypothetical protein
LNRATSMPAETSCLTTPGVALDGPRVQTMRVRLT